MHGANNAARLTISANGTWARNSEAAESFRRALQNGLGYGAISRVAHRLVGIVPEHSVTDQVEADDQQAHLGDRFALTGIVHPPPAERARGQDQPLDRGRLLQPCQ